MHFMLQLRKKIKKIAFFKYFSYKCTLFEINGVFIIKRGSVILLKFF